MKLNDRMTAKYLLDHLSQESLMLEVWHDGTVRFSVLDRFKFNWNRKSHSNIIEVFNWHGTPIASLLIKKSANISNVLDAIKTFRKQQGFYYDFK